jgi:hypothetical protein
MDGLLFFEIIFSVIWATVTVSTNTAFADAWDCVIEGMPDFNNGYATTCSDLSHPDPYDDDALL